MLKKKCICLGQTLVLAMFAVGLITTIVFSWVLYNKQSQIETDLLIHTSDALLVPIINVATRGVNGGNMLKLKGKDATSFYQTSGVLYLQISGTTKAFPKSAFAAARPPSPIAYNYVREGVNETEMQNLVKGIKTTQIDEKSWFYIVTQKLPDVENGGQIVAVFSAQQLQGSFWRIVKSVGLIGVIILAITILLAIFIGRWITRPIVETSRSIKNISESLDLTSRVDISAMNEVGETAEAFNLLLDKLHDIIIQVDDSVIHISSAAEQLANSTTEASTRIQDQDAQTEQVASAMTEMTAVVDNISDNANSAASAAQAASQEANEGKQVVNSTVEVIQTLAGGVETATRAIQRVGEDSQNIDSVLGVIRGIAEQTNLLALNAAIEAARAGEQGRGFAVVADEVRSLASRTQESTEEIQKTIEHLQSGVTKAVKAIESGQDQAHESVTQANNAGNFLSSITSSVEKIKLMNEEIAVNFKEQSRSSENISSSITRISELSEHATLDARETSISSEKLSQLSEQLKKLVSNFKLH